MGCHADAAIGGAMLHEIIKQLGGQAAVARAMGVRRATVAGWLRIGGVPDTARACALLAMAGRSSGDASLIAPTPRRARKEA